MDKCMKNLSLYLKEDGIKVLGSCCGHGKYPPTIICNSDGKNIELFSGKEIPRKRNFYKLNKNGVYFIPEVIKNVPK